MIDEHQKVMIDDVVETKQQPEEKQPEQKNLEEDINNEKYYNLETVQKQVEDLIMQVDSYVEWQENQRTNFNPPNKNDPNE